MLQNRQHRIFQSFPRRTQNVERGKQRPKERDLEARIRGAMERSDNHLDLSNLGLTTLPNSIFALDGLRKLTLSFNPLSDLSPDIGNLANLQNLNLHDTNLKSLPDSISA